MGERKIHLNYCGTDSQLLVISSKQDTHIKQSDLHNTDNYKTCNTVLPCFPVDLHSVSFELLSGKVEDGIVLRLHKSLHNHPKKQ